jgi:hypothetical protein
MLVIWSNITSDLLGVIKDASICNAGVLRGITQCGNAKYTKCVSSFNIRKV